MEGEADAAVDLVGGGDKVVARYTPGGNFGEPALFLEGLCFEATVTCAFDTDMAFISRLEFTRMFSRNGTTAALLGAKLRELEAAAAGAIAGAGVGGWYDCSKSPEGNSGGGGGGDGGGGIAAQSGWTSRDQASQIHRIGRSLDDARRRPAPLIARHGGAGGAMSGSGGGGISGTPTGGSGMMTPSQTNPGGAAARIDNIRDDDASRFQLKALTLSFAPRFHVQLNELMTNPVSSFAFKKPKVLPAGSVLGYLAPNYLFALVLSRVSVHPGQSPSLPEGALAELPRSGGGGRGEEEEGAGVHYGQSDRDGRGGAQGAWDDLDSSCFFSEEWETDTDESEEGSEPPPTGVDTFEHTGRGDRERGGRERGNGRGGGGAGRRKQQASRPGAGNPRAHIHGQRTLRRRQQPLGPPPEGDERLGRLLDVLERHALFQGCERRLLRAAVKDM